MRVKKSLIVVLTAVLFVFGMAGAAMAAFGTGELDTPLQRKWQGAATRLSPRRS